MRTVRVTGGALKGQRVALPFESIARYTAAKVREAIFNLVGPMEDADFLDLFAGSGSVAIEALSRGARSATLVESNRQMFRAIELNLRRLSLQPRAQALNISAQRAIPFLFERHYTYKMIFLDPPYEQGLIGETMGLLSRYPLHTPEAVFILEHSKRDCFSRNPFPGFVRLSEKRYGDTFITLLVKEEISA